MEPKTFKVYKMYGDRKELIATVYSGKEAQDIVKALRSLGYIVFCENDQLIVS